MNNLFKILVIVIFVIGSMLCIASCKKEPIPPVVTTNNVTGITQTTAMAGGNVTDDGDAEVTIRGVCWSTASNPTITGSKTSDGKGTGSFTSSITSLAANTLYYVKAYATNSKGTSYGNVVSFTTKPVEGATVTTTDVTSITPTTAVSGGNITDDGGASVTARGVCWSVTANPTTDNSKTSDGQRTGSFTSNITGLQPGTAYHVRAYATNSIETTYGNDKTFTSKAVEPTVTTATVSAITQTTATSGGNVTSNGGATITARGVCYSTVTGPTVGGSHTSDGTGEGPFTSNLTGLTLNTKYYLRAYATNSAGTGYGNEVSFTTNPEYPMIRLKTGTGLNPGATINFVALSKDDNYFDLSSDEMFAFSKTDADWYIDGDVIPFTTDYKELKDSPGEYYLLLRASGLVMVTTITVASGNQTFLIFGTMYGGVLVTVEQPKGHMVLEQNPRKVIYHILDTMPQETNAIKMENWKK